MTESSFAENSAGAIDQPFTIVVFLKSSEHEVNPWDNRAFLNIRYVFFHPGSYLQGHPIDKSPFGRRHGISTVNHNTAWYFTISVQADA
jgi:hypothetical protein